MCYTVRALADEYFGTGSTSGSKALELRFGEGVPGIKVGKSWLSKKARLQYLLEITPSITSLWSRNAAMYVFINNISHTIVTDSCL